MLQLHYDDIVVHNTLVKTLPPLRTIVPPLINIDALIVEPHTCLSHQCIHHLIIALTSEQHVPYSSYQRASHHHRFEP